MKNFILLVLFIYVLYKEGSFFFRAGAIAQQMKQGKDRGRRDSSGKDGRIKGGDYVDYEEVR